MENNYKSVITSKKTEAKKLMTDAQIVKCNVAIHTASVTAGTEAFIPIPGADAIPITATQITMIVALGKIFGQKISESAAKAVISAAAASFVGRSLVKLIPVAGWVTSAAITAGVTEAIGWTAAVDFANQTSKSKLSDHVVEPKDVVYSEKTSESINSTTNANDEDGTEKCDDTLVLDKTDATFSTDATVEGMQNASTETGSKTVEADDPDDESISNDFSKMFGEEDE